MSLDYEIVRQCRDVCEHLNACWYKFDDDAPFQLCTPEGRVHRQALWDCWNIQLIRWGEHPILDYRNSRFLHRNLKGVAGWRLLPGWEYKIDFLEQVYILNRDPDTLRRPWMEQLQAWLRSLKCPMSFDCGAMMDNLKLDSYECPNFNTCKGLSNRAY